MVADVRPDAPVGPNLPVILPPLPGDYPPPLSFLGGLRGEFVLPGGISGGVPSAESRQTCAFDPGEFFRGDSNHDGALDITDPVYELNFLFLGGPSIPPPNASTGCGKVVDYATDSSLFCTDPSCAFVSDPE